MVPEKPGNPMMAGREPYAVALVDLSEGVRMMSEVVGGDPWTVAVGDAVTVGWEPLSDGRQLPVVRVVGKVSIQVVGANGSP